MRSLPDPDSLAQIEAAYRRMATEALYRPAAPSDGLGYITIPLEELDLEAEADEYAQRWWECEDHGRYDIGCPDWSMRPAMIFAVEAAHICCGAGARENVERALTLLLMAAREMEELRARFR